ncbi:unnamed protein product [Musa acuminata var. zebrina]
MNKTTKTLQQILTHQRGRRRMMTAYINHIDEPSCDASRLEDPAEESSRAAPSSSPSDIQVKMVANGEAPARGSAAAAASIRRRRTGGAGAAAGANAMLQFYTDETAGRKMSPNTVLIMSIGFIAIVAVLHVFGKVYRVPN